MSEPYPDVVFCFATAKVRHPSRKVALRNLRRVRDGLDGTGRDQREFGRFGIYLCRRCSGWHIGNRLAPEPRTGRKREPRHGRYDRDHGEAA